MRNISENAKGNYPRVNSIMGFPAGTGGKEPTCQSKRQKKCGFNPWIGKIPWRRAWVQTLVFLPKNPMDRGAWRALVQRVTKSQTGLKRLSTYKLYNESFQEQRLSNSQSFLM